MALADSFGLFWNSVNGDRKYNAESFEFWLKKFFTSGVFTGDLQVLASSGMTVSVQTGYSNVDGKVRFFETVTNVTLAAPNSTYPRIDTIVIERNDTDRTIEIKNVTGAYSGQNPQPTAPVRSGGIYQLVLAQIIIRPGISEILQSYITDTRSDPNICGIITGTVTEMDFSQFAAQFEAYYQEFVEGHEADFDTWMQDQEDSFEDWVATLHDILDEETAGHLQLEIEDLQERPISAIGTCSTAADTAQKNVTLSSDTDFELKPGAMITVLFVNTNTASNPTLKVGATDAKSIWYNTEVITTSNLNKAGYANRYMIYIYNGTYWVWIGQSIDDNTTYTPPKLGIGYGTCSTATATSEKAVTLSNYTLVTGGIVAVKFTYAVGANAKLNINSKGAKNIYYRGSAITAGIIGANDVATFIYDGTRYHLLAIDSITEQLKVTQFSVPITGWTSDTTSQSGTTLYKKQISLTAVYTERPEIDIGSSGVLPSVAQQEAYNLLKYVTVDDTVPCLYLYASKIPSTAFYINVKGVE